MPLFETADSLRRELARFDQQKTASKRVEKIGEQRSELLRQAEALRQARARRARVLDRAPADLEPRRFERGPKAREKADALREHLAAHKTEIDSGKAFAGALREAKKAAQWFEDDASRIWQAATREAARDRVTGLRNVFGRFKRFVDQIEALAQVQTALRGLAQEVPDSDENVELFFELAGRFEAEFAELPLAELDNLAVTTFLRAASRGGAPISSLTEEVREWLAAHDLEHDFVIRIK